MSPERLLSIVLTLALVVLIAVAAVFLAEQTSIAR
jgi:hypothetical protein